MRKTDTKVNVEYFSDRLEKKLSEIINFPCTLVEAASGFGKTTAVKHYLARMAGDGCRIITYRFLPENTRETSWEELCEILGELEPDHVSRLKVAGFPTEDSIADIRRIIHDYKGEGVPTFLFFDDYQAWNCDYAVELIDIMTTHQSPDFHVVIASHPFRSDSRTKLVPTSRLYHLVEDDLVFGPDDIREYYRAAGINLTDTQLEDVVELTGGWAIALYLQLDAYMRKGRFEYGGMNVLMEKTVWSGLSDKEKDTYLQLSVLPSFTLSQAVGFSGSTKSISEKRLREKHYFIQYSPQERRYYLHTQLKKFLNDKFELLNEDEKKAIYHRAGRLCWEAGDRVRAIRLLYLSGHWSEIYDLPSDVTDFSSVNEDYTIPMIIDLMEHSDREDMYRHPNVPIYMMFTMFMMGHNQEIVRFAPMMGENIAKSPLSQREKEELTGELELLLSFLNYNRIDEMSIHHRKAWDLLKRPSRMFNSHGSWCFGSPSVLYLYWRESGKLNEELDQMDDCMPWYYKLSKDHGAGSEIIMRAEADLNRGDYDKAEIGAYRAVYEAVSKMQTSIAICATLVLARVALIKGNKDLLTEAQARLKDLSSRDIEDLTRYTYDMADGYIAMLTDDYGRIKPWLKDGRIDANHLAFLAQPYAFIIFERYLLARKDYAKLIGISQMALKLSSIFPNLLTTLYTKIYCASAYEAMGSRKEAVNELAAALEMAGPDNMLLPFAENYAFIKSILPDALQVQKGGAAQEMGKLIAKMAEDLEKGIDKIGISGPKLSDRERQVLELVKRGLTNGEIAKEQLVSLSTVKKQVSSLLLKYGLASREQLKDID